MECVLSPAEFPLSGFVPVSGRLCAGPSGLGLRLRAPQPIGHQSVVPRNKEGLAESA